MKTIKVVLICILSLLLSGCKGNDRHTANETTEQTTAKTEIPETTAPAHPNTDKPNSTQGSYYKPTELSGMNLNSYNSRWCWERSAESEHFYVFWEKGFGNDPNSRELPDSMRVSINDLLSKAEKFYEKYAKELGFYDSDSMNNSISEYKLQIYLHYQTDWLATGAGYDNKVGALWINPSTCRPVGSTIAHEVGHCFQYLIYCHQVANGEPDNYQKGFRYGYPESNGGNGFWEQTAQWQALQLYPNEIFTWYHMDTWFNNYHRAFENEWIRYQSYWLFYYITEHHGIDSISNIWKNSVYPEDSLSCYMRLYLDNNLDALYEKLYEYAAHMATFDLATVKDYAADERKRYSTTLYDTEDGYRQVAYGSCPEAGGFNVIPLSPELITAKVTADFVGLEPGSPLHPEDPGQYMENEETAGNVTVYNQADCAPGWRYGFVAYCGDGSRVYGEMNDKAQGTAVFELPENAEELYFVVLGAPTTYCCHAWDETELTDVQMPYKVNFTFENES